VQISAQIGNVYRLLNLLIILTADSCYFNLSSLAPLWERVWREGPKNSDKFPLTANSFICYLILADSADKIEVSGMKRIKRNCGSQKGNQNARNRGFYAFTLTPAETCRFLNIFALNRMLPFCVAKYRASFSRPPELYPFPSNSRSNYHDGYNTN
jgi:hypothetical protein